MSPRPPISIRFDGENAVAAKRARVLGDIAEERYRQHDLHGDQTHLTDGTSRELALDAIRVRKDTQEASKAGTVTWRHILTEEVAEAFAETDPAKLRAELVQVAAVAAQWVEAIDARGEM